MIGIFYIVVILLLILHVFFSLKKNKFVGLIIPMFTILALFYGMNMKTYSITWNNNTYEYSTQKDYNQKINELLQNNQKFESNYPETNEKATITFQGVKVLLGLEIIIYIICWQIKKRRN